MHYLTKLKPLTKHWPLAIATLLLPSSLVLAGGKATLITTNEATQVSGQAIDKESHTISLTWDDVDTLRMDFGTPSHYLIARDGKTYSITQEGGETLVMDMDSMSNMIQSMSGQDQKENPFGTVDTVKATKDTETIAGIKGKVYHITWTEADGSKKSDNAVLTDDPLVIEMTRAYFNSISAMGGGSDYLDVFLDSLPNNERGILKIGEQFYVESIQKIDPPASTFELPAKPVNLQNMIKGLMAN